MAIDFQSKTKPQLNALIENYRKVGKTTDPIFVEALRVRELKFGLGLNFETSLNVVKSAAKQGRYTSYQSLADATGANWAKVHWQMGEHLQRMLEYTRAKGWPPLSVIVVNAKAIDTGEMKEESLTGFLKGAREVGYDVEGEPITVLRRLQQEVFDWAGQEINA
jgi:hypothetical protein